MWRAALACSLAVLALGGAAPAGEPEPEGPPGRSAIPLGFCFAPEMDYIPEVDGWPSCQADAFSKEAAAALEDWAGRRPWVEKQITPELVRNLSGWAKPQMQQYAAVPALSKVAFKPVAYRDEQHKLVLEGTVDTLPTHSPLVTRWLKLYLLYDVGGQRILRATVTIRGQLLE